MKITEIYNLFLKHKKICTDTRKIQKGSIFFALKGEKFNGNQFATQAINKGCSIAIIDEKKYQSSNKHILVKNVLETLQKLAQHHRKNLSIPIIGITGTNGKTTSKELIHSVLETEVNCYATKGNLNNHIGVPLSILKINNSHKLAIIEMGANHKKEIKFLCNIAQPTHGIITNIGTAHLEGFKNNQTIIDTKNEIYEYINQKNGIVFVNSNDKLLLDLSSSINRILYGETGCCIGKMIENTPYVIVKYNDTKITSKLIGQYQFNNIMLAICIGKYFNIKLQNIKNAIESYIPKNNRSEILKTKNNILILDAYNANPSSMKAMINSFAQQNYSNKICILGDMLELGKYAKSEHRAIFKLIEEFDLKAFLIGNEFSKISKQAFKNKIDFIKFLESHPIKNKTILIKGSRGLSLEKLTKHL